MCPSGALEPQQLEPQESICRAAGVRCRRARWHAGVGPGCRGQARAASVRVRGAVAGERGRLCGRDAGCQESGLPGRPDSQNS